MNLSWVDFWNHDNPLYVNERHKMLHARAMARDIISLIEPPATRLLDYGCGEALEARHIATHCQMLYLHDAAPAVLAKAAARLGGEPRIRTLDQGALKTLEAASLDLILIHSVAQYIPRPEFFALIAGLAGKLAPGGRIVIGDVLPPGLSPLLDARALLAFGVEGGFFLAAIAGLLRTFFSSYRDLRRRLGLVHYAPEEIFAVLGAAGLAPRRLARNPGHNQARMAFEGKKR